MSSTFVGELQRLADAFAREVDARALVATDTLTATYATVRTRLLRQLDALIGEMDDRLKAGAALTPGQVTRVARVMALLRQADEELLDWYRQASAVVADGQRQAVDAALRNASELLRGALAPAPFAATGVTATFNGLPAEALRELIGVLQDGTPVRQLLEEYGRQSAAAIREEMLVGLASGVNPREVARRIRATMDGNAVRALTVARTELLRAYRESSLRLYRANRDVVTGWVWWSSRTERTCPVCWAMHATKHALDEMFGSHPNCRCTPLPETKTWRELGFGDVPGDKRLDVEPGEEAFKRLPAGQQRRILGPAKYRAYSQGTLTLPELVKVTHDARWGITRTERSFRDLRGGGVVRSTGPSGGPPATPGQPGPPVTPAAGRSARRVLRATEQRIRTQPFESAYVYDTSGNLLLHKDGQQYSVGFTRAEVARMKGGVFTHNHPGGLQYPSSDPRSAGNSFSPDDINVAVLAELAEIRAVTPKRRFSMRPGPGAPWPDAHVIQAEYDRADREVSARNWQLVRTGARTIAQAEAWHFDEVWTIVAKRLGLRYRKGN